MDATKEKEVLEAVLAGDKESFEAIVRHYQGQAYSVALSLVNHHADALDLSQEAFLRAFRALRTFDTTLPFFPWFYRILRNLCLSHLKRRRRVFSLSMRNADDEESRFDVPSEEPGPNALVERSEDIDRFYSAYARLPLKDREILALRHFQEMAYADIAHVLDIPIGTVMSRLFYARRKLRTRMEDGRE